MSMIQTQVPLDELEHWESQIRGNIGIVRFQPDGTRRQEVIRGGRDFRISTEHRLENERLIKRARDNPFRNGQLRLKAAPPAREEEVVEEFKGTSATVDNDDLMGILEMKGIDAFRAEVAKIDDVPILDRMAGLAEDHSEIHPKRREAVLERINELEDRTGAPSPLEEIDPRTGEPYLTNPDDLPAAAAGGQRVATG